MSNKSTGGPAFPLSTVNPFDRSVTTCDGMTLRDYFAAKAMAAMISQYPCQAIDNEDGGIAIDSHALAVDAYDIADAMLEAKK
jgi:hypothetical protein